MRALVVGANGYLGSHVVRQLVADGQDVRVMVREGANTIGIRSEHMEVSDRDGSWKGKVIHSENLGSDSYVYVDIGADDPIIVRQPGKAAYHAGDTLGISPRGDAFLRFDQAGKPLTH